MKCLLVLSMVTVCAFGLKADSCKKNNDCGQDQCCVSNSRWMIASKRAIISGGRVRPGFDMTGGTCVTYIKKGASCHYKGFTSCGCEPGTKCVYYSKEVPSVKIGKRKMIFRPGDSFCETA